MRMQALTIYRNMRVLIALFLLVWSTARTVCAVTEIYDLSVLPKHFAPLDHDRFATSFSSPLGNGTSVKHIPRLMWISFKTRPESLEDTSEELATMINHARKDGWTVYCLGHVEQLQFMEMYYPETSLLWAIKQIHPNSGAAMSDIWRVAALYAFGGMYIDDDSTIEGTSLEEIETSAWTATTGSFTSPAPP